MSIPNDLHYSKDHEWTKIEGEIVTIGITDYAQGELGDIIFFEFPEVGMKMTKGDPFGTIEAVKTVADLFAPISGRILEINSDLEDNPALVNEDPYSKGWLIKIELSDRVELDELLDAEQYGEFIG